MIGQNKSEQVRTRQVRTTLKSGWVRRSQERQDRSRQDKSRQVKYDLNDCGTIVNPVQKVTLLQQPLKKLKILL